MNKDKLRFIIAKEIDKGNKIITEKDFDISQAEFDEAVSYLYREGYLKGIAFGDNRPILHDGAAYLTKSGETYLKENNNWLKAYKGLKEARDWIKP